MPELRNILRQIMTDAAGLSSDSIILVTGWCIEINQNHNVMYVPPDEVIRMVALPAKVGLVLSTPQRPHTVGVRIEQLAKKQHMVVPQHILSGGRLKEMLEIILRRIQTETPDEEKMLSNHHTKKAAPTKTPISIDDARALFRTFLNRREASCHSEDHLVNEFSAIIETGGYHLESRHRRRICRQYRAEAIASRRVPHCDSGRRRDRNGNIKHHHQRRKVEWW